MTKPKRLFLYAIIIFSVVLILLLPKVMHFIEKVMILADKVAVTRSVSEIIYPQHIDYFHMGENISPSQLETSGNGFLAALILVNEGIALTRYPAPLGDSYNPVTEASTVHTAVAYRNDPRI